MYIGITKQNPLYRWNNGNGYIDSAAFWPAIQKYGWDNIKHEILLSGLCFEEAKQLEIKYIAEYKSNQSDCGYNCTIGGDGICGYKHTKEARSKMSDKRRGEKHFMYGKKFSSESKQKMSDSHKGVALSEETRNRMSVARRGEGNPRASSVNQYSANGDILGSYKTINEAAAIAKTNPSAISQCCRGKHKTCGGYIWRYATEVIK